MFCKQGEYDRCLLLAVVTHCAFAWAINGFEPGGEGTQHPPPILPSFAARHIPMILGSL